MTNSRGLRIHLLGHLQINFDDRPIAGLQTDRFQSLLAYLVLLAQTPQPRSHLASLFWPDTSDTQAKANLRRELYRLRKILPHAEQFLNATSQTIQWQPQLPFWLDVSEFEGAIARAASQRDDPHARANELQRAAELYLGELLPNCYDDWIVPERDRLHKLMVHVLEDLSSCLSLVGDTRGAIAYCQQLLVLEPLNETGYLQLMLLHTNNGDRATALQIYHQCMTQLREGLGIDPSAEIQHLYQTLITDPEPSIPTTSTQAVLPTAPIVLPRMQRRKPRSQLVGRAQELQTLQSWSLDRSGNLLLLLGEPGIGKTRLFEAFATLVEADGGTLLWGQGFKAELLRPYGAWIDALRTASQYGPDLATDLPAELGILLPELGAPVNPVTDRGRLFDAVVALIHQLAQRTSPLIVILDDIQWLDDASVALFHYAFRLLRGTVRFACLARDRELFNNPPVVTAIQALRREHYLEELTLAPLNKAAIFQLVTQADRQRRDISPEWVNDIYRDSGGNPLFALAATQTVGQRAIADYSDLSLPIGDTLSGLTQSAQSVLTWAAALEHSFDPLVLGAIADCSAQQLSNDLEQLENSSILRVSSHIDSYEFAHDLVRQSIYQKISIPRRKLIHRTIAEYLHTHYASNAAKMVEVVHHAAIAQQPELLTSAALAAAQHSQSVFAFGEAVELAQTGLKSCHLLDLNTRVTRQLDLLRVWVLAGVNRDEVGTVEDKLKAGIREAQALNLQEAEAIGQDSLMLLTFDQDRLEDLHQHSLEAAKRAKEVHPSTSAKLLASGGVCLASMQRDINRAEAMLLEAQSLANRIGLENGDIDLGLGCVYRYRGQWKMAEGYLSSALLLGEAEHDRYQSCQVLMEQAALAVEQQQWEVAIVKSQHLIFLAEKLKGGSQAAYGRALNSLACYALKKPIVQDLNATIQDLVNFDARRKLAFVLSHLSIIEMDSKPREALTHARAALAAAQIVGISNDVALAWSLLMQSTLAAREPLDVLQVLDQVEEWLETGHFSHFVVNQLTLLQTELAKSEI